MKNVSALTIVVLFACPVFASDDCNSVWVYKPFKSCATSANGLNLSAPSGEATTLNLKSEWVSGGKDQAGICREVTKSFNEQNMSKGLHAELGAPKPVGEESENRIIQQEYRYACELQIRKFPLKDAPNAACGTEEKFSYKIGGASRDLPGSSVSCLSCDNFNDKPPASMVTCLRDNIQNIVEPKAIELRDSDLNAVSLQVKRLLNLTQQVPIENLRTTEQLSLFTDFVNKYPGRGGLEGGGGGIGRLPTLQ